MIQKMRKTKMKNRKMLDDKKRVKRGKLNNFGFFFALIKRVVNMVDFV